MVGNEYTYNGGNFNTFVDLGRGLYSQSFCVIDTIIILSLDLVSGLKNDPYSAKAQNQKDHGHAET